MTATASPVASISPPRTGALRVYNPVLLALVAAGIAAACATGFVAVAPNRLLSGRPLLLWDVVPASLMAAIAALAVVLFACCLVRLSRIAGWTAALAAAGLCIAVLAAAGAAASGVPPGNGLQRVSLGAGFWVLLGVGALALMDALQRARAGFAARLGLVAVVLAASMAMARAGWFDVLSLAHEYQARHDVFAAALTRHIELVAASVIPAIAIGVPLAIAALRRPRLQSPVFATLNLLQTIPSVALFGLLIAPLSGLAQAVPVLGPIGVGGVGVTPALIALVMYALLPVVRGTVAALGGVTPAVLDAGRGMGMSRRQLFWRVELPLAAPVLIAALRVVVVQAIGLAVVAALIGAGGLGTFVFEGLGEYAADLILLGALPAIALALAADLGLQALAGLAERRERR